MMFSRACAPLCAAACSCTAFLLALPWWVAWCATFSLKLIWLTVLLAASLVELMWHYGGQRSLQALWFGIETLWWLYVLPHAWLADRTADYTLTCRWLPSAAGSLVSRRRFALALAGAITSLLLTTMSVLECLIRERLCVCVPWAIQLVCRRDDSFELDPSFLALAQALWRLVCAFSVALDSLIGLIWERPRFVACFSMLLALTSRA